MTSNQKIDVLQIINQQIDKINQSLGNGQSVFVRLSPDKQATLYCSKDDELLTQINGQDSLEKRDVSLIKQYFLLKKQDGGLIIKSAKNRTANLTFFFVEKTKNELKNKVLDTYLRFISETIFDTPQQKLMAKKICLLFTEQPDIPNEVKVKISKSIDPRISSLALILDDSSAQVLQQILNIFKAREQDEDDISEINQRLKVSSATNSGKLTGGSDPKLMKELSGKLLKQDNIFNLSQSLESSTVSGELFQSLISSYIILNRTKQSKFE